jgi:YD repeat-containing protein
MITPRHQIVSLAIFISMLLGNNPQASAQKLPDFVSQTPQAAALSKYSEYPVSNFTGVPSINVPLYTIESGDISLPIGLNYHAGGFKVSEEASWVGLGWTLTANGLITRTVNGVDDFNGSVAAGITPYHSAPKIVDIVNGCPGPTSGPNWRVCDIPGANNFINPNERYPTVSFQRHNLAMVNGAIEDYSGYQNSLFDWEPDMYSINIMGLNGKFVMDQDKNVHFLEKQDIEVKKTTNGWMARSNDGFQYYFENKESSQNFYGRESNGSWYITKIVSPTKREMKFFYEQDAFFSWQKSYNEVMASIVSGSVDIPPVVDYHTQDVKTQNVYLTRIEFDNGYAVFTRDTNLREDLKDAKRLKTIQIYNTNNKLIKEFELTSSYFNSNSPQRGYIAKLGTITDADYSFYQKRLKLDHIIERNGTESKKTQFKYAALNLPNKDSFSQDHWGYYNGQNNTNLIASFEGDLPNEVYTIGVSSSGGINSCGVDFSQGNTSLPLYTRFNSSNRDTNPATVNANVLQEIIYPTGGKTTFEFEANQYKPAATGGYDSYQYIDISQTLSKNARPGAPDLLMPSTPSPFTFTLPAHVSVNIPKIEFIITGPSPVTISNDMWAEIKSPKYNKQYFAYNFSAASGNAVTDDILPVNIASPITLSLNIPELDRYQYATIKFSCRLKVEMNSTKQAGGLRVKSISHVDGTNSQNDMTKTYNYNDTNPNQQGAITNDTYGILKTPVRYWGGTYGTPATACRTTITFASSNTNSMSLSQFNHIGYSKVIEYVGKNKELGRTEYIYINNPNMTFNFTCTPPGVPSSVNWIQDGKLSLKSVYNNTNKMVYEESNGYQMLSEKVIKSIYQDGFSSSPAATWGTQNWYGYGIFHYCPIFSRWEPLTRSQKRTYNLNDNNYSETTSTYEYNPENLLPSLITTTDSNGNTLKTKNYYPNEVNNNNYTSVLGTALSVSEYEAINQLKRTKDNAGGNGDFKTASPLQVDTYENQDLLSRQRTNFKTLGNITLPATMQTSKANDLLENRIVYHRYDSKGNPIEISNVAGVHIVYLWGYNNLYPVAKIENTTYAAIEALADFGTGFFIKYGLSPAQEVALRAIPNAMITTFTHEPLVGLTSVTDPKGYKTTYEYDSFNRLSQVKDKDGNILNKNEYKYKN